MSAEAEPSQHGHGPSLSNHMTNRSAALAFITYAGETQLPLLQRLIDADLSEPYSVFTYRYFLNNWPHFCILAMDKDVCVATIVGKHDLTKKGVRRGYIAMLVVEKSYRKLGLGSKLVQMLVDRMLEANCSQVVLETEVTNKSAVRLYEKLGFIKDKRLYRYYMNGVDAFRLKLLLPTREDLEPQLTSVRLQITDKLDF